MKKISWDSIGDSLSDENREWNRKIQDVRSEAIAYIGLGKKPSGQVEARLRDEGFDEDIIRAVIAQLKEEKYLDDVVIARRMIKQRRGRRAESKQALRQRMIDRGLAHDAIDQALSEMDHDDVLAHELIHARFPDEIDALWQQETPLNEKKRLFERIARFLSSRGFDAELIQRMLHRGHDDESTIDRDPHHPSS
jgi:regulatory protein